MVLLIKVTKYCNLFLIWSFQITILWWITLWVNIDKHFKNSTFIHCIFFTNFIKKQIQYTKTPFLSYLLSLHLLPVNTNSYSGEDIYLGVISLQVKDLEDLIIWDYFPLLILDHQLLFLLSSDLNWFVQDRFLSACED